MVLSLYTRSVQYDFVESKYDYLERVVVNNLRLGILWQNKTDF